MKSLRPVAVAFLLFAAILSATVAAGLHACGGHFGYPLDDTYIHMAMAKNFALHRVWGITRYAFSSSTSSPLFTLLLAGCYALTGVHELTPFILNCIAGLLLLLLGNAILVRQAVAERQRILVLCLVVVAIPLPTLVLVGMEHVLHTVLTLLFVALCCTSLVSGRKFAFALPILTALLVTARYEGVFLVAAAGLLFLLRGMWTSTASMLLASVLPLAVYGWISILHGWYPVPSSLLLKANLPSGRSTGMFGSFSSTLIVNLSQGFHLVALVLVAIALLYTSYTKHHTIWTYSQTGLILFIVSAMMHLGLARVGWFFRYESYLIALGIFVSAIAFYEIALPTSMRAGALIYLPLALFAISFTYRSVHATYRAPQAISDIYNQQYQMGLFARDNFAQQPIILADIGAVSFLSEAKVLDLIGLGSLDSLTARIQKRYSTAWLDQWGHNEDALAALTAVQPVPQDWIPITTWTIPNNYISGADHVTIYALKPSMTNSISSMVDRFRNRLPARVIQDK